MPGYVFEQVGQDDHEGAPGDPLGYFIQRRGGTGAATVRIRSSETLQGKQDLAQVGLRAFRVEEGMYILIERDKTCCIALLYHEEVKRGCQVGAVFQLGETGTVPVAHGRRRIQHDVVPQVRLLLVLLHVGTVRLCIHLPVYVPQFVARVIGPMLGELDGESVVGALVEAGDEPFHDEARPQLHVLEAGDEDGIEETARRFGGEHGRGVRGSGIRTPAHEHVPTRTNEGYYIGIEIRIFQAGRVPPAGCYGCCVFAVNVTMEVDGTPKCINFDGMDPLDRIKAQLMDAQDLDRTLNRMARQIVEELDPDMDVSRDFALIGMQTRGVPLAKRLQAKIRAVEELDVPIGILDATMYRDDFRLRLKQPVVRATHIPFDVTERHVVLVDDVLYTGRTARAALDALMDLGRPASVRFLVIVDRGLHELPIMADYVGRRVPTLRGEEVRVRLSEVDDREGVWLVEHPSA